MGSLLQNPSGNQRAQLRAMLEAAHPEEVKEYKAFPWESIFSWGALACAVFLMGGISLSQRTSGGSGMGVVTYASQASDGALSSAITSFEYDMYAEDAAAPLEMRTVKSSESNAGSVIDYEMEHGTSLEQSLSVSLLTQQDHAAQTVADLIASLGGHLESIRVRDEASSSVFGSVPAERMSLFLDGLQDLVKSDAFIVTDLQGQSLTSDVLDLEARMQSLRDTEASVTEQLHAAKTDAEKKKLEQSLKTLLEEIASLTQDQDSLASRGDYVSVSVDIEQLAGFWGIHDTYELREYLVGYDRASIFEEAEISVLDFFFTVVKFVSVTFWILIPCMVGVGMYWKKKRLLRSLE